MGDTIWTCLFCDRLYVEPDYDRENFGTPICPFCGRPHWDNSSMEYGDVYDLISGRKVSEIKKLNKREVYY